MKRTLLVALACVATACVFHRVEVREVVRDADTSVTSPVKAHLRDGSTVVFPDGVQVANGLVRGTGTRFDLTLAQSTAVAEVDLDEVVGMEAFETRVNVRKTTLVTTAVTAGSVIGGPFLAVAIFGSCPTVYSDDGVVEEAELFSNSIAPLFERRDVDRLSAGADAGGSVRLEVRNEAMETHYINHLQLLEVAHAADERVLPDAQGRPVVVGGVGAPRTMTNRSGRDLSDVLGAIDTVAYRADAARLEAASSGDLGDWIDVTIDVEPGATDVALVFRMRNSLLSTVLLYDVMLGRAGARAIDWLGADLANIGNVVEFGRWYQQRAGLHVSVWRDGAYRPVARMPDSGPIAWHDVALRLPAVPGETALRVRLEFLADYWRIDHLAVASRVREAEPRVVPLASVTGGAGEVDATALSHLSAPDDQYLVTNPGEKFFARFEAGPLNESRTFLLSSQGYYTEWIRGDWIKRASDSGTSAAAFTPSDDALSAAISQWITRRESFETEFMANRVPVR